MLGKGVKIEANRVITTLPNRQGEVVTDKQLERVSSSDGLEKRMQVGAAEVLAPGTVNHDFDD